MMFRDHFKNAMREPLVHFLIAGLFVFALASWRGAAVDPADRTITIDEDRVSWLAEQFSRTWQRSPNPEEIDQLIRDYVKEEVYYREALRMGLEQDDPIIRRRLRSKMEFLAAAEVEADVPDEATLQAWLAENQGRYAQSARFSFEQVYLGAANDPAAQMRAQPVLAQLNKGAAPAGLGQPLSLPVRLEDADRTAVANDFGDGFTTAVAKFRPGRWQGPVESGFGLHLVRVTRVETPKPPKLAEVRQQVENDWRAATLEERQERGYQALLNGYSVRIEKP